jgi:hypothetical protein
LPGDLKTVLTKLLDLPGDLRLVFDKPAAELSQASKEAQLRQFEERIRSCHRQLESYFAGCTPKKIVLLPGSSMPNTPLDSVSIPERPSLSPLPSASGIYFFWDECECVYVGKSADLRSRVTATHDHADTLYSVSWIERSESTLAMYELYFIWLLRPKNNRGAVHY